MNELSIEQTSTIQRYLSEYNPWHDDTQIEFFVIGNNHTDFGRYRQCLAEISTHYEWLKTSYILRKKKQAEKKIIEAEIAELEDWSQTQVQRAKIELKEIEMEEKDLERESIEKQIERHLNEIGKIMVLAEKYEKAIEGKDRKELEREYHKERLSKLLALNTVWGGGNLSGVMDIITSLPEQDQAPLLELTRELNQIKHQSLIS